MTVNFEYGKEVIEFYPYNQQEFQAQLDAAVERYWASTESIHYSRRAASVRFTSSKLVEGLTELHQLQLQGYEIRADRFYTASAVNLDLTLRKPKSMIDADLELLSAEVLLAVEADRYVKNQLETNRQLAISLDRSTRETERKEAEKQQRKLAIERQAALADLISVYHTKDAA